MQWYGYALLSAALISLVSIIQKRALRQEHSLQYVTIFNILKFVIFLLLFSPSLSLNVTSGQFFLVSLSGIIGAVGLLSVARALRALDMSIVLPILALDPAMVALLAFMFLGERITGFGAIGIALVLVGTFVLEVHKTHEDRWRDMMRSPKMLIRPFVAIGKGKGGTSIIIALVAYAVGSVLDRFMLKQVSVSTYLFYNYLAGTTLYLLLLISIRQKMDLFGTNKKFLFPLVIVAAVLNVFANVTQAQAMSMAAVGLVIAVKRISVLIDVVLGGRLFHERHLPQRLLASAIILFGIYLIVLR